jgi:4-amino-4-deoxy-L-arabinose transferase-like glycosyltransferase
VKLTRAWIAFAIVSALLVVVNAAWILRDHSPPAWDDAYYLTNSLRLYDALTSGGTAAWYKQFLTAMPRKPPLIAALPAPIYLVLGRNPRFALGVNLCFLAMTFAAVFGLARHYASSRAGLLAVLIVGTMPMTYGLSRLYLVECGLTALVCGSVLVAREWASGRCGSWSLGIVCGFGLLLKASFPIYVTVPLVWILTRTPERRRNQAVPIIIGGALLVACPWYLPNLQSALRTLVDAGSAATAGAYGTGAILSPSAIGQYLRNLANCGPLLYFAATILAVPLFRFLDKCGRECLFLCVSWVSPILLLTFSHYRDLRYAAPLFPAVGLALAILLDVGIRRHWLLGIPAAVILGVGCLNMLQVSFGAFGQPLSLGPLLLSQPRFSYIHRANPTAWLYRDLLVSLYHDALWKGGEHKRILVGNDTVHFNADNLSLAALAADLPFDVETTAYENDSILAGSVSHAAYFVRFEGSGPESPFNPMGDAAFRMVQEGDDFQQIQSWLTPDDSKVLVFKHR